MKFYIISLFLFLFFTNSILAQSNSIDTLYKPNLILFMLNLSTNRIEGMKRRQATTEEIDIVKQTDKQTNYSIISDFKEFFKYCPVYYFYSTDYDAVKNKDWDHVTFFDAEHISSPKQIEMNSLGNYFIAEVNYPPMMEYEIKKNASGRNNNQNYMSGDEGYAGMRDYCILLYNEEFKLMEGKLGVTNISLRRVGNIFKQSEMKYRFSGAEVFDRKLNKILSKD